MRWRSGSRRLSRSASTPTWYLPYALRSRRARSASACGGSLLALYRSGRQADALDVFQEARRVLMDELALEPGPELRRLQEAILAHDPAIAPVPLAPRPRGNLPAPSTSFIDREAELAQVVELLREHRLVTLTGAGRRQERLALEAARSLESELRGGAWHVGLANAGSAADVVRLVTQAVDARGADPLARVVARLRDTDAILVFDACEHVLEETARVVSAVLAECPVCACSPPAARCSMWWRGASHRRPAPTTGPRWATRSRSCRGALHRARAPRARASS